MNDEVFENYGERVGARRRPHPRPDYETVLSGSFSEIVIKDTDPETTDYVYLVLETGDNLLLE